MGEVLFGEYCKKCVHFQKAESEYPCDECLEEPWRLHSHKPSMFKDSGKVASVKQQKKSRKKRRL